MSDETITELIRNLPAIIGAFAAVITALGVIFVGYWSYQSNKQSQANALTLQSNTKSLSTVSHKVDGLTTDLVAATHAAASAEGQLKERDAEREHLNNHTLNGTAEIPVKVKVKPDIEG